MEVQLRELFLKFFFVRMKWVNILTKCEKLINGILHLVNTLIFRGFTLYFKCSMFFTPQSAVLRRKGSSRHIMDELKTRQKSLRRSIARNPQI